MLLRGRRNECEALDRLLSACGRGRARCWSCAARPGSARRRCWSTSPSSASGCRVARAAGVESEMELAFAGLHQLCAPMLDRLDAAAGPAARRAGDGVRPAGRATRRTASWSAWRCSACWPRWPRSSRSCAWSTTRSGSTRPRRRRWRSSRGACWRSGRAGVRRPRAAATRRAARACRSWWSTGLGDGDARALLASAIRGRLDERVRDRIVAETRGNPLALLELPRGLTPAELAGGFGLPDARPLAGRIEESFLRRLEPLPAETQRLLLLGGGRAGRRRRAAVARGRAARDRRRRGGAGRGGGLDRARRARAVPPSAGALGGLPGGVAGRAPGGAPRAGRGDRSRASIPTGARGTARTRRPGPTRRSPRELERSAGRAQARGGLAAAAAFLERAAELTPDRRRRGARALAAAQAKLEAGAPDAALRAARDRGAGPARRAPARAARRLRAQIAFALQTRQRRAAAAARRGQAPRAARRRAGPRDLPGSARGGDLRRPPRRRRRRAGGGRGRARARRRHRSRRAPSTCCWTVWRRGSPRATRPARRRCSARSSAFRERGRLAARRHPLALAGLPRRARPVGRRGVGRAGHARASSSPARPARSASSRSRCTYRAGVHVHAGEFAAAVGADRGGRRDHRGDRQRARCRTPRSCSPPGAATRPRRSS